MENQFIVKCMGMNSFGVYGPFDNEQEAQKFADWKKKKHFNNGWIVVELKSLPIDYSWKNS